MNKKKIVGSIFVCMLMCVTVSTVTGTSDIEKNPNIIPNQEPNVANFAPWTLLAVHDIGATGETGLNGNAGAEFDGTYHYSTRWASNLIHQYDNAGNLLDEFSIPGVTGLRDLAWDGQYMYGGAAAGQVFKMDFANKQLVDTFSGSFQSRAIGYNHDTDEFYVSNWGDPVWVLDNTGAIVDQFNLVTTTSTYGFAYDPDPNGPYLWVFDQTTGATSTIYQWDLTAGAFTGFTYDVTPEVGSGIGIAGGLWLSPDYQNGLMCIGGCVQDSTAPGVTDYLFVYELYATNGPPEIPTIDGPTVGFAGEEIEYTLETTEPDGEDVYYYVEWGDGDIEDWIGPYASGEEVTIGHTWTSADDYEIRAKAKDINDAESDWSDVIVLTIVVTDPPSAPDISGTEEGEPGASYSYYFTSTDPDGDDVSYFIDWGDGETTGWTPYRTSGEMGKQQVGLLIELLEQCSKKIMNFLNMEHL